MVRPERFELPASWFVARRSIQLSYGRKGREYYHINCRSPFPRRSANGWSRIAKNALKQLHARIRQDKGPGKPSGSHYRCADKTGRTKVSLSALSSVSLRSRRTDLGKKEFSHWRRGRDSNPRRAFDPYALSRGAPSTTRPPLRINLNRPFAERGMIPARSSLGKARQPRA
jgi:hypothetical protein